MKLKRSRSIQTPNRARKAAVSRRAESGMCFYLFLTLTVRRKREYGYRGRGRGAAERKLEC